MHREERRVSRTPTTSGSSEVRCRQGSGPDRGRCPVEHRGGIPSIRPSVCTSLPGLDEAAQRKDWASWRLVQAAQTLV